MSVIYRRNFLKKSLSAAAVLAANPGALFDFWGASVHRAGSGGLPVVVATWGPNVKATAAAWEVLARGGCALDAVEAGARVPEADPDDSSVGYGGFPDNSGQVTLDACIMDESGRAGSVCFLRNIMHPVSVARLVMEKTPHVMLSGEGAYRFALEQGFEPVDLLTERAQKAWEEWKVRSEYKPKINVERHDTIGILAVDGQGRVSGACTTSGLAFKMPGRVGDSPIIGAGMYADGEVGAAAATGLGELVLRTLGSFVVVEEMRRGRHPQRAAEIAVKRIVDKYPEEARQAQVGFVALDKRGRHGAFAVQKGFNYALCRQGENRAYEAGSLF
ncbi:MAG: N(4)-(beta-N-acetylglucosaminyl)-L-asparaginase [Saprospiraceae bacterium]